MQIIYDPTNADFYLLRGYDFWPIINEATEGKIDLYDRWRGDVDRNQDSAKQTLWHQDMIKLMNDIIDNYRLGNVQQVEVNLNGVISKITPTKNYIVPRDFTKILGSSSGGKIQIDPESLQFIKGVLYLNAFDQ